MTRAHKGWALDSVTLHNDVLKNVKEDISSPPAVSKIYIHCLCPFHRGYFFYSVSHSVITFILCEWGWMTFEIKLKYIRFEIGSCKE